MDFFVNRSKKMRKILANYFNNDVIDSRHFCNVNRLFQLYQRSNGRFGLAGFDVEHKNCVNFQSEKVGIDPQVEMKQPCGTHVIYSIPNCARCNTSFL